MVKTSLLAIICIIPSIAFTQSLERKVVSSGGDVRAVSGISLSSNIGETCIQTVTATGAMFTQGFEQSNISKVNIRLFLEGYYASAMEMRPAMYYEGVAGTNINMVDTVVVQLMDPVSRSIEESSSGILSTAGYLSVAFSEKVIGKNYFICIRHRNSVATWSASTIMIQREISFDITTSSTAVAGENLTQPQPGVYAIYSGDMDQDGYIDSFDYTIYESDNIGFAMGYLNTDLNGDGFVDSFDFTIYEVNNRNFVSAIQP